MFTIDCLKDDGEKSQFVVLKNENLNSYAKIDLRLGGSLQELILDGKYIIKDLHPFEYKESFASAILFPFVNRIENGVYTFNNQKYQLEINDSASNSALHGLVYNKTFEFEKQKSTIEHASATISLKQCKRLVGFPFLYEMNLAYVLDAGSLTLIASVKNIDIEAFPFSIGWHPYFYTTDLYESYIDYKFKSIHLPHNEANSIASDLNSLPKKFQIKNNKLDDCYQLNSNKITFTTPDYSIHHSISSKDTFLQLYTPSNRNALAIELQTSPANSFNNQIGLQLLQPNESFEMSWKIELIQTN